jgi:hypothetical protein
VPLEGVAWYAARDRNRYLPGWRAAPRGTPRSRVAGLSWETRRGRCSSEHRRRSNTLFRFTRNSGHPSNRALAGGFCRVGNAVLPAKRVSDCSTPDFANGILGFWGIWFVCFLRFAGYRNAIRFGRIRCRAGHRAGVVALTRHHQLVVYQRIAARAPVVISRWFRRQRRSRRTVTWPVVCGRRARQQFRQFPRHAGRSLGHAHHRPPTRDSTLIDVITCSDGEFTLSLGLGIERPRRQDHVQLPGDSATPRAVPSAVRSRP